MSGTHRGFSRMAPWYRALEFLAFGGDLERARFAHLPALKEAKHILLLGEGDGRFAERAIALSPQARIVCVDSSPGMVARAKRRFAGRPEASRVRFICADARTVDLGPDPYDAVATLFFLDCFTPAEVESLVARTDDMLFSQAVWLFADFAEPERGWRRIRARAWLGFLYACFGWETGLKVRNLPPAEAIMAAHGWQQQAVRQWQHGLLRSALYQRRS